MATNPQNIDLLIKRVANCRRAVVEAIHIDQETDSLRQALQDSMSSSNYQSDQAAAYATLLRGYISGIPDKLEKLLKSAQDPAVAEDKRTASLQSVAAGVEGFEKASEDSEWNDLVGLLPRAYLAHRLMQPQANSGGIPHQVARELLGPHAETLDAMAVVIEHSLGNVPKAPKNATPGVRAEVAPVSADTQGATLPRNVNAVGQVSCRECVHLRRGDSVTRAVFKGVPNVLQPPLRQTYAQLLQMESSASGGFLDEQQSLEQSGGLAFSSKPTDPRVAYCGFAEFEGIYYCCEVKNRAGGCTDFSPKPKQPVAHSCNDCRHLHRVPPHLFHDLEEVAGLGMQARQSKMEMQQTLQAQATSEFEECIQQVGILQSRPGFLPVCEARSLSNSDDGASRYIVGPVLNVNGQCDLWEHGSNEHAVRMSKEFAQLVADAKRAVAHGNTVPVSSGNDIKRYAELFYGLAANSEADVFEYGLKWLNVEPQFIEHLCSQLMRDVWFVTERTDRASRQQMVASLPSLQPNVPFIVELDKTYRHPDELDLTLSAWPVPPKAIVKGIDYYLANIPRDIWVRLQAPGGELLSIAIQVTVAGGRMMLSAMWLPVDAPPGQESPTA